MWQWSLRVVYGGKYSRARLQVLQDTVQNAGYGQRDPRHLFHVIRAGPTVLLIHVVYRQMCDSADPMIVFGVYSTLYAHYVDSATVGRNRPVRLKVECSLFVNCPVLHNMSSEYFGTFQKRDVWWLCTVGFEINYTSILLHLNLPEEPSQQLMVVLILSGHRHNTVLMHGYIQNRVSPTPATVYLFPLILPTYSAAPIFTSQSQFKRPCLCGGKPNLVGNDVLKWICYLTHFPIVASFKPNPPPLSTLQVPFPPADWLTQ